MPTHGAEHEACEPSAGCQKSHSSVNVSRRSIPAVVGRRPVEELYVPLGETRLWEARYFSSLPAPVVRLAALSQHASVVRVSLICHVSVMHLSWAWRAEAAGPSVRRTADGLIQVRSVVPTADSPTAHEPMSAVTSVVPTNPASWLKDHL